MADISIVRFNAEDVPFGMTLTDMLGWHRTAADWQRLVRIEPDGIFKAVHGGKDAGSGGVVSYGRLAWIHSIIVSPELRGKGIARALVLQCIKYARGKGAECIKLDAVAGTNQFYKGLGFIEEFESKRFVRSGEMCLRLAEKMKSSDLDEVFAFDYSQTGLGRGRVLKDVFRENQPWAFLLREQSGIRGYIMAREGEVRVNVGPCVCLRDDERCAMDLLKTVLGKAPSRQFRATVSGSNANAVKVFKSLRFEEPEKSSTRMYMGREFHEPDSEYAMISSEKG